MKFLPLIWRNLLRRKTRTIFTLLLIFVSFVLYGVLMTIGGAFAAGIEMAAADRLVMMHKVSLIQLLPIAYQPQIQSMPGVTLASHNTWFGGTYQNNANAFAVIAVEPEPFLKIYPEFKLPDEQYQAWLKDRQGFIVGRDTATRYGWKVGDRVPIRATIWQPKQGDTWYFNVSGIYDGDASVDRTSVYFRYDYLDENRRGAFGQVGWYVIRIGDPNASAEISAALDALFANSSAETKTSPEKAFMQGFANQIGDIGLIMRLILTAVLFVLLIGVANTMGQSVRERTSELAVLKTLGFTNATVLALVLAESIVLAVVGGGLGLGLISMLVSGGGLSNAFLPVFNFTARDQITGVALILLLGVLAGAPPAIAAMRLRITDALRKG